MDVLVRPATLNDEAAVVAFTEDTWIDRGGDYIPRVFEDWVRSDDETQRTFVAELDGAVKGILQCVLLSDREAWMQGMRVAPDARKQGLSHRLNETAADWAWDRGATVVRNMVFSWNGPALASSRSSGFAPATEFRWAHLEADGAVEPDQPVVAAPDAGWTYWQTSAARDHLRGLGLAPEESWAVREVTPETLKWAADSTFLGVVQAGGSRALSYRVRDYDRTDDDGERIHWSEYGVAAWAGIDACGVLFDAIRRDAAAVGADRARVLIPETVAAVSDAALMGAGISDEPDFVFAADLTDRD
ncbi:MAG: GNAT family N-acetyltransferase [Halobacteriales archaeon]